MVDTCAFDGGAGLAGRRALITGGASGFGLGIAAMLSTAGAAVTLLDRDRWALTAALDRTATSRAHLVACDVLDEAAVEAAVADAVTSMGGLDTLVNSAGVFTFRDFEEITADEWDTVLGVNLRGTFLCCRAAMPHLRSSGRGRIVNIASDCGKRGGAHLAHYSASKFGVVGLTQSLAQEFGPDGVTVNAVCPATTPDTEMGRLVLAQKVERTGRSADEVLDRGAASFPLRRLGTVADVANAVCFLISDGASWMSGESVNIDGGNLSG